MVDSWTRIIVLRFSSIGDIIQTTSVLNTLKKYFPKCTIEYLTLKKYEPLLLNHSSIDFLHSIDPETKINTIKNLIDKRGYDIIIDLHNSVRSKLIRKKSQNIKSYYVTKPRKNRLLLFMNHRNKFNYNFNQKMWLHQSVINLLPANYESSHISLKVTSKEKKEGVSFLNDNGLGDKNIYLNTWSSMASKQWSAENISINETVHSEYALPLFLIGSKKMSYAKDLPGFTQKHY